MKKTFLTIIAAVAMTLSANAQISIIPKVGLSIATFGVSGSGTSSSDIASKVGLQLGVAAEIGVNDMFAIQPELLFIQKGAQSKANSDFSTTLNYLEIPVLAKVKFGSEDLKFYAIAGPSLGIAIGGKDKGTTTKDVEFGSDPGQTKRTDFGLQFGAGVMFKGFVLDVRYGLGLTNTINVPSGADFSIKNRAIGITVGYAFPLGGK